MSAQQCRCRHRNSEIVLFVLKGILLDRSAGSAASHHCGGWGPLRAEGQRGKKCSSPKIVFMNNGVIAICVSKSFIKNRIAIKHTFSYLRFILVVRAVGLQAVPGMNRGRQFCGRRKWSFLFGDFLGVRSSWILRLLRWRGSDLCCIDFHI